MVVVVVVESGREEGGGGGAEEREGSGGGGGGGCGFDVLLTNACVYSRRAHPLLCLPPFFLGPPLGPPSPRVMRERNGAANWRGVFETERVATLGLDEGSHPLPLL